MKTVAEILRAKPQAAVYSVTPSTSVLDAIKLMAEKGQLDARQFLRTDLTKNTSLLDQTTAVPLRQGDLLLFHSNLFHAAGRNMTNKTKFSMVFTYRAGSNPPAAGSRSASKAEIALI